MACQRIVIGNVIIGKWKCSSNVDHCSLLAGKKAYVNAFDGVKSIHYDLLGASEF